jgi:hypothetical protein
LNVYHFNIQPPLELGLKILSAKEYFHKSNLPAERKIASK